MRRIPQIFLTILILFGIFSALPVFAQSGGLVPCDGVSVPCDFAAIMTLIQNVLNFMIYTVATPIAALMFAYAGYLYLTAQDNESKVKQAHEIFISVLWGFGIMLVAWALVSFILDYFTGGNSAFSLLSPPSF